MNSCQGWLLIASALLIGGGCQTPAGFDDLERELRYQSDMIYELQDYVETYKGHLDDCRKENIRLRQQLDGGAGSERSNVRASDGEEIEIPDDGIAPPVIEIPGIDLPEPSETLDGASASRARRNRLASERAPLVTEKDRRVVAVTLDPATTSGLDNDGRPGDEGVQVLLEPRNEAGRIVPARGAISVALLDPAAQTASEARVAVWHLSAEETARLAAESGPGEGVYVQLTWPDGPPHHDHLKIYVRLTTDDGRRLIADQSIRVESNELQARWGPTDPSAASDPSEDSSDAASQKIQTEKGWSASKRLFYPQATPQQVQQGSDGVPPREESQPTSQAAQDRPERSAAKRPEWSPYR